MGEEPIDSRKSYLYDETRESVLGDIESWRKEALAVINDVRCGVKDVFIAEELPSNSAQVFVNVTTLEDQALCIELTCRGFRVVGQSHNSVTDPEEQYFETPYALLGKKSALFQQSFGQALAAKLEVLAQSQSSEVDQLSTELEKVD